MTQKRKKRRAYDQTKDTRRARQNRRAGQSRGYQEQVLTLGESAQPQRRRDNSVEFPTQQARRAAQPQQGGQSYGAQPRPNRRQANQRLRPTQANLQSPARREKRKARRVTRAELRRRRIARRLTAFALLLCVIAAGVYLTVTMLFKINTIEVQLADGTAVSEAAGYTSEEILQALGVRLDDNIFSFDPAAKAKQLEKQFPLLEQIEVVRKYPTTVLVRVVEATPAWAMQTDGGWLTISSTLKIIDEDSAQPALPTLYGGEPVSTTPGSQLEFAAEQAASSAASGAASGTADAAGDTRLEALNTLLSALNSRGLLADVTRIEFADTEQLAFLYQDRISVLIGTLNELNYKMDFAQYLLLNTDGKGCAPTDTGELDCSHVRSDGTLRPILAQGEPTLPSGYTVSAQQSVTEQEQTQSTEQTQEAEQAQAAEQTQPAEQTQAAGTG